MTMLIFWNAWNDKDAELTAMNKNKITLINLWRSCLPVILDKNVFVGGLKLSCADISVSGVSMTGESSQYGAGLSAFLSYISKS